MGPAGATDTIRGLEEGDWGQWLPLWRGYLDFYRAELSAATSRATFERLSGPDDGVFGFIALDGQGEGTGLAHCIVHPTTWSRRPSCYLEDLFVAPTRRGSGLGRGLLETAKRASDAHGAGRLYWHTQEYNGRARSLYDQVGRVTPFVVYEM
ncbi:MAG: GNAT family N-acetyltransferase [Acidimicrobiales bacterium]